MSVFITRWVHRLRNITASELRLIAEAQVTLLSCELERRWRPAGQLLGVESTTAVAGPIELDAREATSVGWAVTRAARYGVFRPQCLVRALAIQKMLQRRGIQSGELRIGVRKLRGVFQAHAWVELHGRILGDTRDHIQSYTPIRGSHPRPDIGSTVETASWKLHMRSTSSRFIA
jgi:hypothetical protein